MSDIGAAVRATHYARPAASVTRDDTMSTAFLDAFYTDPFNVLVARTNVQCADMPEIFSPNEDELADETDHDRAERIAWAKNICADCPIFDECRAQSVERNESAGIWGGLTEQDRHGDTVSRPPPRTDTNRGRNNRVKTHCPARHPYDTLNTIHAVAENGGTRRQCRECRRIQSRDYRASGRRAVREVLA